jgi:hypothetical protein
MNPAPFPKVITDIDGKTHNVDNLSKKYIVVIITMKVGIECKMVCRQCEERELIDS